MEAAENRLGKRPALAVRVWARRRRFAEAAETILLLLLRRRRRWNRRCFSPAAAAWTLSVYRDRIGICLRRYTGPSGT